MRARGEGTLGTERRAGRPPRWVVRHSLPDGRRKARRFPHTPEGREAALAYMRSTTPASAATSTSTLGQYLTAWLTDAAATVAPSTWRVYEIIVRRHLVPALGKKRLDRS